MTVTSSSQLAVQVKKDFQEAVLSYRQDEFFHKNMYANFGDIGSAVKELVDEFQKQTTNTKRINTIEDMQVSLQLQNTHLWHVLQFLLLFVVFFAFLLCGCPWRQTCDFSGSFDTLRLRVIGLCGWPLHHSCVSLSSGCLRWKVISVRTWLPCKLWSSHSIFNSGIALPA